MWYSAKADKKLQVPPQPLGIEDSSDRYFVLSPSYCAFILLICVQQSIQCRYHDILEFFENLIRFPSVAALVLKPFKVASDNYSPAFARTSGMRSIDLSNNILSASLVVRAFASSSIIFSPLSYQQYHRFIDQIERPV